MIRFGMLIVFGAALLASGRAYTVGQADNVELQKSYDQISQAIADHDADKLMMFVAPNAEFIDVHSKRKTADRFKADVAEAFSVSRNNDIKFTLKNIQIGGDKATIYLESVYRVELLDRETKQWIPVIYTSTDEAVWEKNGGVWKLTRSQELRHQETVDPEYVAHIRQNLDHARSLLMPCNFSSNGCR